MSGAELRSGERTGPTADAPGLRFSTDVLPERERVPMFREVFGRNILGIDIAEPLGEHVFRADVFAKQLPGLNILWADYSPLRGGRSRAMLADGNDGLVFQWSASSCIGEHMGRDVLLAPGDGVLISCSDPGVSVFPSAAPMVSLALPREALRPLLGNGEDGAGWPVPASAPAFALLRRYVEILKDENATASPELQKLAVMHVYDLLALAVGPARDVQQISRRRGLRAARLAAIKQAIVQDLESNCSIERVAARHRLSPRYVQRLFEEDATTFTAFVHEQRLLLARRMLMSVRFDHKRISDIALETGFSDLSWFNRLFRRRFGLSPRDVRNGRTPG